MKPETNQLHERLYPQINLQAWDYLVRKVPLGQGALTRMAAYRYLIMMQEEYLSIDEAKGREYFFEIPICRLAQAWGWHRETVSLYLRALDDYGAIEHYRQGKSYCIRVLFMTAPSLLGRVD